MATRQEIIARLRGLQHDDGRLDPQEVVEDARDPASPLHDSFEWIDTTAAELYRLQQARRLIGAVKFDVTVNRVPLQAPVYVRDPNDGVYRTVVAVRSEEEQARAAIFEEMQRVKRAIKKARTLVLVMELREELENFEALIEGFLGRVRSAAEQPEGTA